jgi:branched-chain amino acid transport system substrate-binding protein
MPITRRPRHGQIASHRSLASSPPCTGLRLDDTVYLIAAAIRNSGDKVTRESIRENLQNIKGFVGLTGPIQFNPAGDIFRKYLIVAVENGKFVRKTDYDYAK